MDEEKLNISIRKFLKNVGITSQRKIEEKARLVNEQNEITKSKKIKITAKIVSDELNLSESIDGEIEIDT